MPVERNLHVPGGVSYTCGHMPENVASNIQSAPCGAFNFRRPLAACIRVSLEIPRLCEARFAMNAYICLHKLFGIFNKKCVLIVNPIVKLIWWIPFNKSQELSASLTLRFVSHDAKRFWHTFLSIKMPFNIIQLIERRFLMPFGVAFSVWNLLAGSRATCLLLSGLALLWTAIQCKRHKLSLNVSSAIIFYMRPRARFLNQSGNGPVPTNSSSASTTFTSTSE